MKKRILSTIPLLFILVAAVTFSSCKKDESCGVVITLEDANGVRKPGYWVVFGPNRALPPGNLSTDYSVQLVTDAKGQANANFKLEATIEARIYAPGETTFTQATEVRWTPVNLEPGQTVRYTVIVP